VVSGVVEYTGIEWTDRTWNPVTGCTKVSPGCEHCYAERIARRFTGSPAFPDGFAVTLHPERLGAPLRWRGSCRVFVNSMSDLFHPQVPSEFIARVFAVMAATPWHTYQVLTKRPARMRALLTQPAPVSEGVGWPLPNVHLGVSAEDQKRAQLRIPVLLRTPAVLRFLSAEPLLGPLVLHRRWLARDGSSGGIGWVIVGGESGPGARPMRPEWARSLRDQCQAAGVAFFFKQWGEWAPTPSPAAEPELAVPMVRVGRKAAGRLLDGRIWEEFPEVTP
jgi:protein gp37